LGELGAGITRTVTYIGFVGAGLAQIATLLLQVRLEARLALASPTW